MFFACSNIQSRLENSSTSVNNHSTLNFPSVFTG